MIKTLIIEDEEPAYIRLRKLIEQVDPEIEIVDWLDSVESAINWFSKNEPPELFSTKNAVSKFHLKSHQVHSKIEEVKETTTD